TSNTRNGALAFAGNDTIACWISPRVAACEKCGTSQAPSRVTCSMVPGATTGSSTLVLAESSTIDASTHPQSRMHAAGRRPRSLQRRSLTAARGFTDPTPRIGGLRAGVDARALVPREDSAEESPAEGPHRFGRPGNCTRRPQAHQGSRQPGYT